MSRINGYRSHIYMLSADCVCMYIRHRDCSGCVFRTRGKCVRSKQHRDARKLMIADGDVGI